MKLPENYEIFISEKRRSFGIKITPEPKVKIYLPSFAKEEDLEKFITRSKPWIDKTLYKIKNQISIIELQEDEIFLLGEKIKTIKHPESGSKIFTDLKDRSIKGDIDKLKNPQFLKFYYTHLASRYLIPKAYALSKEKGFNIDRVTVRDQKTRWGTCSNKKNISLNFRLILCPEYVQEYLILHELCHTKEMNHSSRFWQLVEEHYPGYRNAENYLKKFEKSIFSIIP